MDLPKIETTVKVAKFVVGISTFWTVKEVIKNNVEPDKKRHEAQAYIGGAAVGKMTADATEDWIEMRIRDIYAKFEDFKQKLNGSS